MADFIYVNPEYSDILKRANLLDLDYLLRWNDGICVGEHSNKKRITICSDIIIDEQNTLKLYIRKENKVSFSELIEDIVNFRFPLSRAFKTLRATELLNRHNIDVASLLCVIDRRFLNLPYKAVAVQKHVNGRTLYEQLAVFKRPVRRQFNPVARIKLFYELGAFIKKLHQAKIDWPDFVAKHIIVNYYQYTSDDKPWWRFTLIDVDRLRGNVSANRKKSQLKKFLRSFCGFITSRDLIRMARGYIGYDGNYPREVRRNLWRKFFPEGWKWIEEAKDQMHALKYFPDNVPLQEEELYERVDGSVVNMRFKEILQQEGLLKRNALFNYNSGTYLTKKGLDRRTRMRFEIVYSNDRKWFYLKRVFLPKIKDQIDRILCGTIRHSSCWHERYMIKQLTLMRIPAPTIVAYSERMFLCFELKSALITEGIVGQSLEKFVPKVFSRSFRKEELSNRRDWIRQLAKLISRFHKLGFCHRDLYLSHIFISFSSDNKPIFYLIDLARCFKPTFRRQRWIIKDLSALNYSAPENIISNTDRMRFFRCYLGKSKITEDDKNLIYKIIRKTNRIAKHNRKRQAITYEKQA